AAFAGAAAGAAPRPAPPRPPRPAAAAPSAPRPGRGKSAALPKPGPSDTRNGCPAWPRTYLMSEKPAGGSIRPMVVRHELHAWRYAMFVSGAIEPPGPFGPPAAVPIVIAASGPSILLTTGGLNIGPFLYALSCW